jgi:hypothetical protein
VNAEHPDAVDLLRRFEPVLRSTKGNRFYPMDVEPYVRACSLWVQRPDEEAVCVVPDGKLTLENVAQQPHDESGAVHFLKFTDLRDLKRPASRGGRFKVFRSRAARGFKESREAFRAGRGRLARVGYFSRFIDPSRSWPGDGCRGKPRPRLRSPTSGSWPSTSITNTTAGWYAKTAG